MRVLIVEDEVRLAETLRDLLELERYTADICHDGESGLDNALSDIYDLVILDVMLPKKDGFSVLRALRQARKTVPVLMLSARSELADRVEGLDCGADYYLTKPFDIEELSARLKALVRRSQGVEDFRCGELRLDLDNGQVYRGTLPLEVSGRELSLLKALMMHPGKAVTKDDLLQTVFGDDVQIGPDAIEVLVHRLRKRLQGARVSLVTLRGVGYFLMDDALAER